MIRRTLILLTSLVVVLPSAANATNPLCYQPGYVGAHPSPEECGKEQEAEQRAYDRKAEKQNRAEEQARQRTEAAEKAKSQQEQRAETLARKKSEGGSPLKDVVGVIVVLGLIAWGVSAAKRDDTDDPPSGSMSKGAMRRERARKYQEAEKARAKRVQAESARKATAADAEKLSEGGHVEKRTWR